MNALGSDECSSGCESGWTLYLDDHSSNFNDHHQCYDKMEDSHSGGGDDDDDDDDDDDEEDLSMLSDASSGPPHFPDHQSSCFNAQHFSPPNIKPSKVVVKRRSKKRQKKVKENKHLIQDQQHHDDDNDDDDTASSPLFDFSMNNITVSDDTNQQTSTESSTVDYSQGFSATYFEERSSLQLESFLQENEAHHNKNWHGGKEMGIII